MSNEKLRKETENVIRKLWAATLAYFRSIDRWFALLYVLLCGYGLLVVAGVAHSFSPKSNMLLVQAAAMLIGAAAVIIISKFDYHSIARLWKLYLPAVLALVALTFVVGAQRGGADDRAWLLLPGGLSLQPSEFLKIAFILTFALHIYVVGDRLNRPLNVLLLCLNGAWPVLLIHLQGDDGSALIFFVIFLVMAFCGGLAWPYMLAGLGLIGAAVPVMWNFVLNADQKQRIEALITPGSDPLGIELQQNKARISIGSGQFFGRGLFAGDHNYVPEIQNDFIFSFIGEALGFVGCLLVFALFVLLFARILIIARRAADPLGRLICVGIFAMLAAQLLLNLGMNLGVLPVIGVTLPFFSAGGSSIVTVSASIGLVMSVAVHSEKTMFEGVTISLPQRRSRARRHVL